MFLMGGCIHDCGVVITGGLILRSLDDGAGARWVEIVRACLFIGLLVFLCYRLKMGWCFPLESLTSFMKIIDHGHQSSHNYNSRIIGIPWVCCVSYARLTRRCAHTSGPISRLKYQFQVVAIFMGVFQKPKCLV